MGCGCGGGGTDPLAAYKVVIPGRDPEYVDDLGEARVLRGAYGPTTIIMKITRAQADKARAEAADAA